MLHYVILEAMLAIDREMIRESGLRAVTLAQTGNLRDALKDLDWILEQSPEGVDVGACLLYTSPSPRDRG